MIEVAYQKKAFEILEEKLSEFRWGFSCDIVASTCDDVVVMTKFGWHSNIHEKFGYNHGFHLAIIDALYNSSNPV